MRSDKEIYDLILGFAESDSRIRVVGMEGSRVNKNVLPDLFQDYDVSYLVTDMESFKSKPEWIDIFGDRIILQEPENSSLFPPGLGGWYSYLMLFKDGNRIDLKLIPVEDSQKYRNSDKLLKILLDKDHIFAGLPEPSDEDFHVKKPTRKNFVDCCNEFWWVSTYVAKGLARKEILYANDHINFFVRPMLLKMISWRVGIETDFSLSVGKNCKYLQKYLPEEEWSILLSTYETGDYDACWKVLFTTIDLFRINAMYVKENLGYSYNIEEDENVTAYLKGIYLSDSRDGIASNPL
ncbi:MAG: aminoglycoside 6-adenylyltransferase [Bacteroidales bacterium]|nr:aminoglycoside 6-adenylyltransferase [Bacteroidales bacterium]